MQYFAENKKNFKYGQLTIISFINVFATGNNSNPFALLRLKYLANLWKYSVVFLNSQTDSM